ncbi:hypothetical protein EIL87_03270 [Saccharopolyspora rhizosphaerae]|uniref:DUF2637 domain-containing protein n=1 Tax=Saccharopolyspora rhizosphaerae TaxID=2492662 RepID=A0A426K3W9_9PSEU|nr:hypothetical protein [Saccharopolyspora rhizosphaerae]RRO20003.1 hypothetical protein EIL87_03270 [Saccharopolyspora rhizosphaerae]
MSAPQTAGERRRPLTRPDAEAVEQVRKQVDRLCWSGILLGLAFTMTNVQSFAANGAPVWSLPWLAAWLLDPMVSLVLLAILRAEQVTARCGIRTGGWVRGAKWFTLAATYVMNTWGAYAARSADMVVLHSVPPLVVFVAAEAVTDLRDKLTAAVRAASVNADSEPAPELVVRRSPDPKRRITFDEYLGRAREEWRPDITVTPAWIREVTGCSRGLSSRLAAALTAEVEQR